MDGRRLERRSPSLCVRCGVSQPSPFARSEEVIPMRGDGPPGVCLRRTATEPEVAPVGPARDREEARVPGVSERRSSGANPDTMTVTQQGSLPDRIVCPPALPVRSMKSSETSPRDPS